MVQVASQDELIGRPRLWKLVVFELLLVTEYWSGRVANLSSDNVSRLFFHRQIYKPARLLKVVIIMEGKGNLAFRSRNNGCWLKFPGLKTILFHSFARWQKENCSIGKLIAKDYNWKEKVKLFYSGMKKKLVLRREDMIPG